MIREDYIMRMIHQVGDLIRRILNRNISQENIEEDLEALTEQWIGLPASMLLSLPVDHVYRLFEDSDRMVIEKSYLMGEIYRAKGIGSKLDSERFEHFEKASFFYRKCSGMVEPKLQGEIDKRLSELEVALKENPESTPFFVEDDSLQLPETQASIPRPALRNKRTKEKGMKFWYAIAACLIGSAIYILIAQDDVEITDRNWKFEDGLAQAEFRIVNNTDQEQLIRLKLSIERNSRGVFNSEYALLDSVEREYIVASESSRQIEEAFEYPGQSPSQSISIAILSYQSIDSIPVGAL